MKKLITVALAALIIQPFGFCDVLHEDANELYARALKYDQGRIEGTSYRVALKSYNSALGYLERLLANHPESGIAKALSEGKTEVSGIPLNRYRELKPVLTILADAETDPFSCALWVANTIVDGNLKADTLTAVASNCIEAGRSETAILALEKAVDATDTINVLKSENAAAMASTFAKIGILYDKLALKEKSAKMRTYTLKTFELVTDKELRAEALASVVLEYANADLFDLALITIQSMDGRYEQALAQIAVAEKCTGVAREDLRRSLLSQAMESAQALTDDDQRTELILYLAIIYAVDGQTAHALELLDPLGDTPEKLGAMVLVVNQYASIGMYEEALEFVARIPAHEYRAKALIAIAHQYAEEEQGGKADEVLQQAQNEISDVDPATQAEVVTLIAEVYASMGRPASAIDAAMSISDEFLATTALARCSERLAEAGQLERALEIARKLDDSYMRGVALCSLAGKYTDRMKEGEAAQLLDQALEAANGIANPNIRDGVEVTIASQYAHAEKFEQALITTHTIRNTEKQVEALIAIADAYTQSVHMPEEVEIDQISAILIAHYPVNMVM